MQGRLVGQLGRPSRTRGEIDSRGSMTRYKATPKAGSVRRESERDIVPMIAADNITRRREGPVLR
jgi:hypothetical protein